MSRFGDIGVVIKKLYSFVIANKDALIGKLAYRRHRDHSKQHQAEIGDCGGVQYSLALLPSQLHKVVCLGSSSRRGSHEEHGLLARGVRMLGTTTWSPLHEHFHLET